MRLCYADPPYPGRARKYYRQEPDFAGEVDHVRVIASLGRYDGWALSTSEDALRYLLPLCPREAHVCPWIKPIGASPRSRGLHNCWEPVIVVPGRRRPPGVRDWLSAQPARGGGTLPGRKPAAFALALFDWLGMLPGDQLDEPFPGTGIVSRTWSLVSSEVLGDVSPAAANDTASLTLAATCAVCRGPVSRERFGSCWCRALTCSSRCGNEHRRAHDFLEANTRARMGA